ncbi:transcriptional regulator, LytTR family [Jannaschia pohangensis]|uniref:Transcriptional regulator, LytTR family n=2 Tax=Jannaschia pohangensis TaxID=390807 RepID=A0A1I3SL88_9RHOB|nr:transcriptional regulator, LytTR family [Jannaschia pohangensis]
MRGQFARPATWVVLLGIAVVLAALGPFETDALLRPLPRAAFWLTHTVSSYGIAFLIVPPVRQVLGSLVGPWLASACAGAVAGVAITFGVMAINAAILGYIPHRGAVLPLAGTVILITVVVTLVLDVIDREMARSTTTSGKSAAKPPTLLDRLPLEKRGALVSVSVEDHYVRIRTDKGEELVLMRLSDALRETGNVAGLQVHRSHWVALDQVTAARREGDRAVLTLRHGPEISVSRANLAAIREAGLLPR